MVGARSVVVALGMMTLFYASFDSDWFRSEPAPAGISAALMVFTLIFGVTAWATSVTGDRKRSQLFAGVGIATGLYGLGRIFLG
jgi:hypothetical protein